MHDGTDAGVIASSYHIDEIELDYEPRRAMEAQLADLRSQILMYEFDTAFLCGLLERFKPRKIVEVGIANGGSTAVMMQCVVSQGIDCDIHSVDIKTGGFLGSKREIGYLGNDASELLGFGGYHRWTGTTLPQVIEQIGDGIDCLVLDTTHCLPGEMLDFLAAVPFMSPDALVVLHDVRQNHKDPPKPNQCATAALFGSVVADKYLNSDATRTPDYPNTGAFRLNAETRHNLANVVNALTLSWDYMPDEASMQAYGHIVRTHYPTEVVWLYDHAVEMNRLSLERERQAATQRTLRQRVKGRLRSLFGR